VYLVLSIIHLFGATLATLAGMVGCVMGLVGVLESNVPYATTGTVIAIIALVLQRFFISLDPSYMYRDDYW